MSEEHPSTPEAPPTMPVGLGAVQRPPAWPAVLGIISIVLGIMGALNGIMSSLAPIFMSWMDSMMSKMGPGAPTASFAAFKGWEIPSVITGLCTVAVASLLIIGGSGLVARRPWGVKIQKIWAVLKLLLTPVVVYIGIRMQMDQTDAAMQQAATNPGGAPPAGFMGAIKAAAYGLGVVMVLWGWALPVTSLIWLNTARAKKDISAW